MHATWSEDPQDREELYKRVRPNVESMLSEAVECLLDQDLGLVIDMCNAIDRAVQKTEIGTIKAYLNQMSEEQLANILGWSAVGTQYGFLRCMETAMLNDQFEEA